MTKPLWWQLNNLSFVAAAGRRGWKLWKGSDDFVYLVNNSIFPDLLSYLLTMLFLLKKNPKHNFLFIAVVITVKIWSILTVRFKHFLTSLHILTTAAHYVKFPSHYYCMKYSNHKGLFGKDFECNVYKYLNIKHLHPTYSWSLAARCYNSKYFLWYCLDLPPRVKVSKGVSICGNSKLVSIVCINAY